MGKIGLAKMTVWLLIAMAFQNCVLADSAFRSHEERLEGNASLYAPQSWSNRGRYSPERSLETRNGFAYQDWVTIGRCVLDFYIGLGLSEGSPYTAYSMLTRSGWITQSDWESQPNSPPLPPDAGFPSTLNTMLLANNWQQTQFMEERRFLNQYWIPNVAGYTVWSNPHAAAGAVLMTEIAPPIGSITAPGSNRPLMPTPPGPLRKISDFAYLAFDNSCWDIDSRPSAVDLCHKRLEWVIHSGVGSMECLSVIQTIMGSIADIPAWPGRIFPTSTDAGKALVGCPNGYGVAMLAGDRAGTIGRKTIDYLLLFGGEANGEIQGIYLAWHLKAF